MPLFENLKAPNISPHTSNSSEFPDACVHFLQDQVYLFFHYTAIFTDSLFNTELKTVKTSNLAKQADMRRDFMWRVEDNLVSLTSKSSLLEEPVGTHPRRANG